MAAALTRLKMLDGYEEAELVAARTAASKMGFFTSPDGDGYSGVDIEDYRDCETAFGILSPLLPYVL